jgi:hypothetical protein
MDFIPSDTYTGRKPGYYFSRGEEGLGYYPLKEPKFDEELLGLIRYHHTDIRFAQALVQLRTSKPT